MPRLKYLHRKYCQTRNCKTLPDLEKDYFGVNEDIAMLELYLKGEKVPYWNAVDDYFLKEFRDRPDTQEY